jgi:hypothetical protein
MMIGLMKPRNVSGFGKAPWYQALMLALSVICLSGFANSAQANLVQNGTFTSTTLTSLGGYVRAVGSTCTSNVADGSSTCMLVAVVTALQ